MACRLMLGETLDDLDLPSDPMDGAHVSVKEAVMPFNRFSGSDSLLGPEMRSTGEVMGVAHDFPTAFAKAQAAAGMVLPGNGGTGLLNVTDTDKAPGGRTPSVPPTLRFPHVATRGHPRAPPPLGAP